MMKKFLIALQFLTIVPVKITAGIKDQEYGQSLIWFPFVGMVIGLALVLALFCFGFLPPLVTASVILTVSFIITGGIHVDGFADTCDGLYAGTTREKALAVMRDSRTGAIGVAGIVILLLLKFSLIATTPWGLLWRALLALSVFSRWVQTLCCYMADYPREEGKAKNFIEHATLKGIISGGMMTLGIFLLLMGLKGVVIFMSSLVPCVFFIKYITKRIGGMTGDTIGAASELAEVAILLCVMLYAGV